MTKPCVVCKQNKGVYNLNGLHYCSMCLDQIKLVVNNERQETLLDFINTHRKV